MGGAKNSPYFFLMIVGLDIATSTGVCYYNGKVFSCTTYKGTPDYQLQTILDVLGEDVKGSIIYIEQMNKFLNADTTRSLLHRVGYIKLTLEKMGAHVRMVNAMSVRHFIGAKNKQEVAAMFAPFGLNGDEADALSLVLFGEQIKPEKLEVQCLRV